MEPIVVVLPFPIIVLNGIIYELLFGNITIVFLVCAFGWGFLFFGNEILKWRILTILL